jgi:Tol biopolymer transport system component
VVAGVTSFDEYKASFVHLPQQKVKLAESVIVSCVEEASRLWLESVVAGNAKGREPMNRKNMQRIGLKISLLTIASLVASGLFAADKHSFGLDDYAALRTAQALSVSPDGKTILYQVSYFGPKGPQKHEWFLVAPSGENPRKLDLPEHFEPSGFTKDGSALFGPYEVDKLAQLAIVPLAQGKATQIISVPNGIRNAVVSPDGLHFALLADPRTKDPLAEVHTVVESDQSSIYIVGVNGGDGGWWCPSLKYIAEISWSPDGSQIAVVSQTQKIGSHELHSFIDVCSASGARRIAEIPTGTSGIAWTSGGKELAFASTTTPVLTPDHLWTVSLSGGAPRRPHTQLGWHDFQSVRQPQRNSFRRNAQRRGH